MMYFRCEPNGCATSIVGCAKRHLKVMTPAQGYGRTSLDIIHAGPCRDCPIGAAHALGGSPTEWPDGKRIVRAESVSGLGYNAHKPEPGRGVRWSRGSRIAAGPIKTAAMARPSQTSVETRCECGRPFIAGGKRSRCGECSRRARVDKKFAALAASLSKPRKPGSGRIKLTDEQVLEIRRRRREGASIAQLAADVAVADDAVRRICRGETWRHLLGATSAEKQLCVDHSGDRVGRHGEQ